MICSNFKLLPLLVICAILSYGSCNRERKITDILDTVHRIEEKIIKEDRLREITDIMQVISTVDKLNIKLDRVLGILGNSEPSPKGRSVGTSTAIATGDFSNNLEDIDNRLSNLESSIARLEQSMEKIDVVKIEEIERRITQLKDDGNTKLRKIMNVITAVYEMNKDMKVNLGSRSVGDVQEQAEGNTNTNYATDFLVENLEELERKIKEQFSVFTSDIRSEITNLKLVASSVGQNCETDSKDEDSDFRTPLGRSLSDRDRQSGRSAVENTLDSLVESLGRTSREIREEIHQGMEGIDQKLNNLTEIARSQPQCETMQTSESVTTPRRVAATRARIPVQALAEKSPRTVACTKNVENLVKPKSCADLKNAGATCDGIYVIFPKNVRAVRAYCDMTTDGGGWTVIMRRGDYGDKMSSFHKNWVSYKNGFGDAEGEFWLGNDVIYMMTTEQENMLRVHLSAFDEDEINLDYSSFSVGNETSHYRLQLGNVIGATSTAANSLRYHNNQPFSTYDRKNDGFEQNCASTYKGGWWFNGCYFGFLTGEYFKVGEKREDWQGILWYDWKGNAALKGAEMKIRPKNFISRI